MPCLLISLRFCNFQKYLESVRIISSLGVSGKDFYRQVLRFGSPKATIQAENERDNFQENNENYNCLNDDDLGGKKDNLSSVVSDKKRTGGDRI